jgi:hypothetical protein
MNKLLPIAIVLGAALITGCAGTNQNSVAGSRIADPSVDSQVNAHLDLKNRVSGSGSVETYQVLFVKFNAGGQETNVGNVGNRLRLKENFPINPFELLFRSPADRQAAVDAAYYNAVQNGNCDGLINTRVQVHSDGFSILGLYGHGSANASVEAYGLNMIKGILPNVNNVCQKAVTKSFLQGLFGEEKPSSKEAPKAVAKKKPSVSSEVAPAMAHVSPSVVTDKNGTAYLASTVSISQHPYGKLPSKDNGF